MLVTLALAAHAWTLAPAPGIPLPAPVDAAIVAVRTEGIRLVVADASTVWVLDSAGGIVSSASAGARELAAADVDGDGLDDVVLCGDDGLSYVPWTAAGLGAPIALDGSACGAVAIQDGAILSADLDGSTVERRLPDGAGGTTAPEILDIAPGGTPMLAVDGDYIAAAAVGGASLYELGAYGPSIRAAGGDITGIAAGSSDWWAGLADGRLRDFGAGAFTLSDTPGRIASADLDLDGQLDTVIAYPDGQVGALSGDGSAEVLASAPAGDVRPAIGDVSGGGCPEIVLPTPGVPSAIVVRVLGCPGDTDLDGDGYVGAEDCDDTEADTHPGAFEACDGIDNDCDEIVDESSGLAITAPESAPEGSTIAVEARLDGCDTGDLAVTLAASGPSATCTPDGEGRANCQILDDGVLTLTATSVDGGGGIVAEETAEVALVNVAPTIDADGGSIEIALYQGDQFEIQLVATDPGADTVTFTMPAGEGWEVSPDGRLLLHGDVLAASSYALLVTATDDDGGSGDVRVNVEVYPDYWYETGWQEPQDTGGIWNDTGWGSDNGNNGADDTCSCCAASASLVGMAGVLRFFMRRAILPV